MKTVLHLIAIWALILIWSTDLVAAAIDFGDLGGDTVVTDQYRNLGVVFEGEGSAAAPVIHDYGSFSLGKVLHGAGWNSGLVMRFVEPADPGVFCPVSIIMFDNAMDVETDIISIRVYNAADQLIHSSTSHSPERVTIDFGASIAARVVISDDQSTSFILDNLVFEGGATPSTTSSWGAVKAIFR